MIKRLLLLFCIAQVAVGQQDPQFTHYVFNQLYVNPAAAGSGSISQYNLIHRSQYAGYQGTFDEGGAPTSQVLSASIPVLDWRSGFGAVLVNDRIGPNTMQDFSLAYALRVPVGGGVVALGARAGFQRRGVDASKLRYEDDGDPLIPVDGNAQIRPDFGLGLHYTSSFLSFGLSSVHLTQPNFGYKTEAKNTLKRRYYANLGLTAPISYAIDLQPMLIAKSDFNNTSFEGGMLVNFRGKAYVGSSYRFQDAVSALVGFNISKNIRMSYAGDFVMFGADAKAPTSHELLFSYQMPAIRIGKTSIIRTPRYRF